MLKPVDRESFPASRSENNGESILNSPNAEGARAAPEIICLPDWLDASSAASLLSVLDAELPWRRDRVTVFGRTLWAPRMMSVMGECGVSYTYSGQCHISNGWHEAVADLLPRIERTLGWRPNFALCNRYEDGAQRMGWHRDNEPELTEDVAILSLGASRPLRIRQGSRGPSHRIALDAGSLCVMPRVLWHALPSTSRVAHLRISVTFRRLRTAAATQGNAG